MAKKPNLKELLEQRADLDKEIRELQLIERQNFKSRVEAEAAELGINCYEIWGSTKRSYARSNGKSSKSSNGAKYVDPADPDNVYYLSRGKKPKWLQSYLDEGRKLEDFAA